MKTPRWSRHLILAVAVCAAAVGLFWAGAAVVPAAEPGTVVVAQGIDAEFLDVQMTANIPTLNVDRNIYDSLLRRDQALKIVPHLATSYANLDEKTWQLKLRKGVTFHNGEPFDGAAVKFTIERIFAPGSKSPQKGWFNTIERVDVLDPYTVNLITNVPDPVLPARLTLIFVVPPKYAKEKGEVEFNLKPVGTGPYRFAEWFKGDRVVLEANEKYWGGAPKVKKAIFRAIPEAQARIAALQTGQADLIVNVPPDQVKALSGARNFKIATVPSCRVIYIALPTLKPGPLRDKRVRQAINHGVDVQSIIDNILGGHGKRLATPFTPLVFGHDPAVPLYDHNPRKVKELLAAAGYPQGLELTLASPVGRYLMDKDVSQAVAGQLTESGIKTNVKIKEWGTHIRDITGHEMTDMYLLGWCLPALDPDNWVWPSFHTGEPFSNYSNPEVDKLMEQARKELNAEKRKKLYSQLLSLLRDEAPWLFLYQQMDLYGVSNRVKWAPRSDEVIWLPEVGL
jgi:peptide/nickel transport system substrate-binding protein